MSNLDKYASEIEHIGDMLAVWDFRDQMKRCVTDLLERALAEQSKELESTKRKLRATERAHKSMVEQWLRSETGKRWLARRNEREHS